MTAATLLGLGATVKDPLLKISEKSYTTPSEGCMDIGSCAFSRSKSKPIASGQPPATATPDSWRPWRPAPNTKEQTEPPAETKNFRAMKDESKVTNMCFECYGEVFKGDKEYFVNQETRRLKSCW